MNSKSKFGIGFIFFLSLMGTRLSSAQEWVEGEVFEVIEDHPNHVERSHYVLEDKKNHRSINLSRHDRRIQRLRSGSKVKIFGRRSTITQEFAPENNPNSIIVESPLLENNVAGTQSTNLPLGRRSLAVIVNFADAVPGNGCNADLVRNDLFESTNLRSVNRYYRGVTDDLIGFDGDVVTVQLSQNLLTTCNTSLIRTPVEAELIRLGINRSDYLHVLHFHPRISSCAWLGIAYVGGRDSFYNGLCTTSTIAHELGHNLGLGHSAAYNSTRTYLSPYGDISTVMGSGNVLTGMNAIQKNILGVFTGTQVQTIQTNGIFRLSSADQTVATALYPQLIRLPASIDRDYYLSFRTKTGSYHSQNLNSTYDQKVNIHIRPSSQSKSTQFEASIGAGQTFTDPARGVSINVVNINQQNTEIAVNFGPVNPTPTPTPNPVTGLQIVQSAVGQNNAVTDPNLRNWIDLDLNAGISSANLKFYAKTQSNTSWSPKTPTMISANRYRLFFNLGNTAYDAKVECMSCNPTSVTVSFTTLGADTTPPAISISGPTSVTQSGNLIVTAAVSDNRSVARVEFFRNSILVATVTSAPYQFVMPVTNSNNGSILFQARAFDDAGNQASSTALNTLIQIPLNTTTPLILVSKVVGQNNALADTTQRNWVDIELNPEAVQKGVSFFAKGRASTSWSPKTTTTIGPNRYRLTFFFANTDYDVRVDCAACEPKSVTTAVRTQP